MTGVRITIEARGLEEAFAAIARLADLDNTKTTGPESLQARMITERGDLYSMLPGDLQNRTSLLSVDGKTVNGQTH